MLAAKTVVYNRASSGQGIEALIQNLGLTEQLASRTVRFPDAESVMRHMMSEGSGAHRVRCADGNQPLLGTAVTVCRPRAAGTCRTTRATRLFRPSAATPLAQTFLRYLGGEEARTLNPGGRRGTALSVIVHY